MKYRVLTHEEAAMIPGMISPVPTSLVAVGAENETGEIVACLATFPVVHADPLWVREDHRGGKVLLGLWNETKHVLADMGVKGIEVLMTEHVPGPPLEDTVARLCEHAGGSEVTMRHFIMPVEGF